MVKKQGRIKQAEESRLRLGIEAEEAKHEVKAAHQAALFKPINLKNSCIPFCFLDLPSDSGKRFF